MSTVPIPVVPTAMPLPPAWVNRSSEFSTTPDWESTGTEGAETRERRNLPPDRKAPVDAPLIVVWSAVAAPPIATPVEPPFPAGAVTVTRSTAPNVLMPVSEVPLGTTTANDEKLLCDSAMVTVVLPSPVPGSSRTLALPLPTSVTTLPESSENGPS